jgi:hypothetical protein
MGEKQEIFKHEAAKDCDVTMGAHVSSSVMSSNEFRNVSHTIAAFNTESSLSYMKFLHVTI